MGAMLDTIIRQRSHEGPEKELAEHYGLGGRSVPLAMLRDWEGAARALETRAAATIPADVNTMQHESFDVPIPHERRRIPGSQSRNCGGW